MKMKKNEQLFQSCSSTSQSPFIRMETWSSFRRQWTDVSPRFRRRKRKNQIAQMAPTTTNGMAIPLKGRKERERERAWERKVRTKAAQDRNLKTKGPSWKKIQLKKSFLHDNLPGVGFPGDRLVGRLVGHRSRNKSWAEETNDWREKKNNETSRYRSKVKCYWKYKDRLM